MKKILFLLFGLLVSVSSAFGQATHATLNAIPNNTAVQINSAICVTNVDNCSGWPRFSRIVYDRVAHRMLGAGGGHSNTMYDSIVALDLNTGSNLAWTELFAPTPTANMTSGNYNGTTGTWTSGPSGPYPRPTASHSVGGLTHDPDGNRLLHLNIKDQNTTTGSNVPPSAIAGRFAHYNIATNTYTISSAGAQFPSPNNEEGMPWAWDPIGKKAIGFGGSGQPSVMSYDPATQTRATILDGLAGNTVRNESGTLISVSAFLYNNCIVYNVHDQNFYVFSRDSPIKVFKIVLDRVVPSQTRVTQLTVTSAPDFSGAASAFAYDSTNQVFGTVKSNTFHYFNWRTKAFGSQTVLGSPGSGGLYFEDLTIDYDPVNNVFIYITQAAQTWAYRYIGNAASADFASRCTRKGVIRCEGFDDANSIVGTIYVNPFGLYPSSDGIPDTAPASTVTFDTTIKSSGAGAAKFNVPFGSPPCSPSIGCWGNADIFYNFANDYSARYGANSTFYVFFRAYFGPSFTSGVDDGHGGYKLMIMGEGATAAGVLNGYGSCEDLAVVYQARDFRGFLQVYNKCQGASPGMNHDEAIFPGPSDYKLQNARTGLGCLYSRVGGGSANNYPPNGNCWKFDEQSWMSFKMKVTTGARSGNYWLNSRIQVWAAHDGQAWEAITDWVFGASGTPRDFDPANPTGELWAGLAADDRKYGMAWLGLRNASQWASAVYMLYDEFIVSEQDIAAPGVAASASAPAIPTGFRVVNP